MTWRAFLATQVPGLLVGDVLHVDTVMLARIYVFLLREAGTRRGCISLASWPTRTAGGCPQQAGDLAGGPR